MATKKTKKQSKKNSKQNAIQKEPQSGLKYDLEKGMLQNSQQIKNLILDLQVKSTEEQFEYFFVDIANSFGIEYSKINNQNTLKKKRDKFCQELNSKNIKINNLVLQDFDTLAQFLYTFCNQLCKEENWNMESEERLFGLILLIYETFVELTECKIRKIRILICQLVAQLSLQLLKFIQENEKSILNQLFDLIRFRFLFQRIMDVSNEIKKEIINLYKDLLEFWQDYFLYLNKDDMRRTLEQVLQCCFEKNNEIRFASIGIFRTMSEVRNEQLFSNQHFQENLIYIKDYTLKSLINVPNKDKGQYVYLLNLFDSQGILSSEDLVKIGQLCAQGLSNQENQIGEFLKGKFTFKNFDEEFSLLIRIIYETDKIFEQNQIYFDSKKFIQRITNFDLLTPQLSVIYQKCKDNLFKQIKEGPKQQIYKQIFQVLSLLLLREESGVISSLVLQEFEEFFQKIENLSPQITTGYISCIDSAVQVNKNQLSKEIIKKIENKLKWTNEKEVTDQIMEFFAKLQNSNTQVYDLIRQNTKEIVDYTIMFIKEKMNPQDLVIMLRKSYSLGKLMIKERNFNDLFNIILTLLQQIFTFEISFDVKNLIQISFLNLIQIFNSSVYQIIQAKTNEEQVLEQLRSQQRLVLDWLIKFLKWEVDQQMTESQIMSIKYDVFRQLLNFLKLSGNDSVKELQFIYLELRDSDIETIKDFIRKINHVEIRLNFFGENNENDDNKSSDDEMNQEFLHEDKVTTQNIMPKSNNNSFKRLNSIQACEYLFDMFSQCSEQFAIQHSWSFIQLYFQDNNWLNQCKEIILNYLKKIFQLQDKKSSFFWISFLEGLKQNQSTQLMTNITNLYMTVFSKAYSKHQNKPEQIQSIMDKYTRSLYIIFKQSIENKEIQNFILELLLKHILKKQILIKHVSLAKALFYKISQDFQEHGKELQVKAKKLYDQLLNLFVQIIKEQPDQNDSNRKRRVKQHKEQLENEDQNNNETEMELEPQKPSEDL